MISVQKSSTACIGRVEMRAGMLQILFCTENEKSELSLLLLLHSHMANLKLPLSRRGTSEEDARVD
jgi:hypothetical protein